MTLTTLVIGGLVTWRISHMLVKEAGPRGLFMELRAYLAARQRHIGGMFDMISCVACTSVYIGFLTALALAGSFVELMLYTFAFSAVATLTERLHVK